MIKVAIITVSTSCSKGEREDLSGKVIKEIVEKQEENYSVEYYEVISDDKELIQNRLIYYSGKVDLILTTGGTGLGPHDVTPEATLEVIDKFIPGFNEFMMFEGLKYTKRALLSRGVSGVRGRTLIINLPGSPKAVKEGLSTIIDVIPHAIDMINGKGHD
ncbi:MAG: molybdenum cofactor biosynthesis protein [Caldiserica bacterium]|nr:MAG: molybdenum cofactor biosynthesis protein [Caldisericota bacterium]